MNFFAAFVLFFSSVLCASEAGWGFAAVCALLCLLLSLWVPFLPVRTPVFLRPIAVLSLFLRLYPLWGIGEFAPPVFFALVLTVTAVISFDRQRKRGLLATAAVPFALLLMLCCLFCLAGKLSIPSGFLPDAYAGILASFFCPFSSALSLPAVSGRRWFLPLAVFAAGCTVLPALLFSFPLWKNVLLLVSSTVAAACELRILCGKEA